MPRLRRGRERFGPGRRPHHRPGARRVLTRHTAWGDNMGWSFTGFRGSNNTKTSGAVLTQAPSGTMAVGAVAVCVCVSDNISAGGGQTNDHVVADFVGNRWKKVFEQSNADVAAAGLTLSVWASRLATQLTSSDNVVFGVRQ